MAFLFDAGIFSVEGLSGEILPGTKLYWYESGTSTPLATYSNEALTTPNANPVLSDSEGRFPSIWLQDASYKLVMELPNGTQRTRDPIRNPGDGVFVSYTALAATTGSALIGFEGRTLADKLVDRVVIQDYMPAAANVVATAAAAALAELTSRGGGVLDFQGLVASTNTIVLNGLANITIEGGGAKLTKIPNADDCTIFKIHGGCTNIEIRGFADLDGGKNGSTLASNDNKPVILIGHLQTSPGNVVNENIRIIDNTVRRSMWGGIVVYGATIAGGTPINRNIRIERNTIKQCSNGVFCYKNTQNVKISNNYIFESGYDGVIMDTMAATDAVTTEPITDVLIQGNTIDKFGMYGFGVGILMKGAISQTNITKNTIRNGMVNSGGSFQNYAINFSADSGGGLVTDCSVEGNTITSIASSAANGGYGINVGGAHSGITISNNKIRGTTNHAILIGTNADGVIVEGNRAIECGHGIYAIRAEGTSGNEVKDLIMRSNIVIKGATIVCTGGFYVNYVIGGTVMNNRARDFTSTAQILTNATLVETQLTLVGTAIPTGGAITYLTGTRIRNPAPSTANPVAEWACFSVGAPGLWRPTQWLVGKAPTANRPVLTASDIGVLYMDTTLAASGKPIWWTGAGWVDATGVAV